MNSIDHRDLIERCLSGCTGDITPISLWRHFPVDDQQPESFSNSVVTFQQQFGFDFIKITPASSYSTYDWGTVDEWRGNPEGSREKRKPVVRTPEDWARLKKLDVRRGALGMQLEAIRLIRRRGGRKTPILQTIFNPLSQAKHLAGNDTVLDHIANHREQISEGLATITQTTLDFIQACQEARIDGFFYAVQHAQNSQLSRQQYQEVAFGLDEKISSLMNNSWLNALHIHGEHIYFDLLKRLPFAIINWHDRCTAPSLEEARSISSAIFCGGINQWQTLVTGDPESVKKECRDAIEKTKNDRFILGTGCVTPITAPWVNIRAAVDVARRNK